MQVSLDVSHVKQRRRNLYYTTCRVQFSEEERAIIQQRALFDHRLFFEQGYVDYPQSAGGVIDLAYVQTGARLLFAIGLPLTYFAPNGAALCWILAFALFVYRKRMEAIERKSAEQVVTIADILKSGSFSVCAFANPLNSKLLEHEIREQLANIKALISYSGNPIESHSFEL